LSPDVSEQGAHVHTEQLLQELVLVLAVAVGVVVVLTKLQMPAIAGFIVAGALVGPSGFGLTSDVALIQSLAEGGVVLLLFTIGLEFSIARLKSFWELIALGGGLQVGLTTAGVAGLSVLRGYTWQQGVFFGFLVSLSSTAIVLRALSERNEVDAPHGRMIVGALIFQDLCVVPMMLVTPMLGGAVGNGAVDVLLALGKAGALVLVTLVVGRQILPRILFRVAATRRRELFLLAVLLVCVGVAWLTSMSGLSLALGAFLAGIVLADSEYGAHALSEVLPFREALASLFFISVGMLFDARVVLDDPARIAMLVFLVLGGKAVVATAASLLMRLPARVAVLSGIGLAQVGEFSFVLIGVGATAGLVSALDQRVFVAVAVLTMVVTPLLVRLGPRLAAGASRLRALEKLLGTRGVTELQTPEAKVKWTNHVIVAGWGVTGQRVTQALSGAGVPWLVVELNPTVSAAKAKEGLPFFFGDVTSEEVLLAAGIDRAKALLLLINDGEGARRALKVARGLAPTLPILVRVAYQRDVEDVKKLGATQIVAAEEEGANAAMWRALELVGE
jgi:monovalent cation:H+ antiporter-2, CPA2 family